MVTKNKITTVLFDLDETLSDHSYSLERAFRVLESEFPILTTQPMPVLMDLYRESLDETFVDYLAKKITYVEAKEKRVAVFFKKLGVNLSEVELQKFIVLYKSAYDSDRRATLGTIKTLTILRERGYKIGVVTNGEEDHQTAKLKEIGIEKLVDVLIASGAVGFAKPDPEIFRIALERMQAKKEEAIMIGDNLENDVCGAIRYGIRALYYNPNSDEDEIIVDAVTVLSFLVWNKSFHI
ncbi:MAG: HAD family hydrolase [bacterium]